MASLQLLGTAWTVWKLASKRVGPAGALLVTVAVIGGIVYLRPWVAERYPALSGIAEDTESEALLGSES